MLSCCLMFSMLFPVRWVVSSDEIFRAPRNLRRTVVTITTSSSHKSTSWFYFQKVLVHVFFCQRPAMPRYAPLVRCQLTNVDTREILK